jgi:hypothetical protein
MRLKYLAILATLLAVVSVDAQARAARPSLTHLSRLKPKDYLASKPWSDPAFKAVLTATLAPKARLGRLYFSGPVMDVLKPVDGATMAWACRAHDCSSVNAHVYLEARANRMFVCWHDMERYPDHDWWLVRGRPPEALDPGQCNDDVTANVVYRRHKGG